MNQGQGIEYRDLEETANYLKQSINQYKIELGMALDALQTFHNEYSELGTFKELLSSLHLNMRRTVPLIRNYRYVKECQIPVDKWKYLDSSVLGNLRIKKKTPNLDDIQGGVSYNDL